MEDIRTASLEQVKVEVDNQVLAFYRLLDQIAIDGYVRSLTFIQNGLGAEEHFMIYKLVLELRGYLILYPLLEDVLVVLNHTGTVAGSEGHMSRELFYGMFFQDDETSLEEFKALVKGPDKRAVYRIHDKLYFFQSLPGNSEGDEPITIVLIVKMPEFENQYLRNFATKGSILHITGRHGRTIGSTLEADVLPPMTEPVKPAQVRLGQVPYQVLHRSSPLSGWEFYYLIPTELQKRGIRQIQFFALGGFLFCFLAGIFFSVHMIRRSYDPVAKLLSVFRRNLQKEPDRENELVWIEQQTEEFFSEYRRMQAALSDNMRTLRRYYGEIEQRLINFIRLGDEEKALALFHEVFNEEIFREGFSREMVRSLAADLLTTFRKGKMDIDGGRGPALPSWSGAGELTAFLEKALRDICCANRALLEERKSRQLGEKIKTYINDNFRNPDLNISITALHFNLTPAYLSAIFKEETGVNLLEYINSLRVEEGKKFLDQGNSIIKTAELCGFRSSNTFIRIFRKLTGITPGQYRNIR
jgi:AraC-like DNA-binding protein